eukprot:gene11909-5314_t
MVRVEKYLEIAKGYTGKSKNRIKAAIGRVEKGLQHAYRHRKTKKRDNRSIWIQNINASTLQFGVKYSQFMYGLVLSGSQLNRKMLAELAKTEPLSMKSILELSNSARKALAASKKPRVKKDKYDYVPLPKYATKEYEEEYNKSYQKYQMDFVKKQLKELQEAELKEDEIYEKKLEEELKKLGQERKLIP